MSIHSLKAEIQDLEDQIRKKKSEIERSIDKMEGGQNIWDKARKGYIRIFGNRNAADLGQKQGI